MNSQELEVILKLRDEASAQWKKVADEATKAQGKIKESTAGASTAVDEHGTLVSRLTGFYREEVREQRLQNFLFRQSQEVIGAASVALTVFYGASSKGSAAMKALSQAMNSGFVVFQGLSFALQSFLGPWGMVVAAIGAAVVIFQSLSNAAITSSKSIQTLTDTVQKFNEGIGKEEAAKELQSITQRTAEFRAQLEQTSQSRAEYQALAVKEPGIHNDTISALIAEEKRLKMTIAAYDQMTAGLQSVIDAENQRAAVKQREEAAEMIRFQNEQARFRELMVNVGRAQVAVPVLFEKVRIAATTAAMTIKRVLVPSIDEIRKKVEESVSSGAWESLEAKMQTMASIGAQVMSSLAAALQSAFEGTTKTAKDIFKAILRTVIDAVQALVIAAAAAMWAKGVFLFGANLAADLAYVSLATVGLQWLRAAVGRMHTGGTAFVNLPASQEVPILLRGQETVRVTTPEQETAIQRRASALFRREEAPVESRTTVANVTVNINAPGTPVELVRRALVEGLRQTGLTVDRYVVDTRNRIALG